MTDEDKTKRFRLVPGDPLRVQTSSHQPLNIVRLEDRKDSRLFLGQDLKYCTAERIVSLVEGGWTSQESIKRALKFKAYDGDVMLCAAPKSGEGIILAMLQLLALGENSVDANGKRTAEGEYYPIPFIENKGYDANPRALDELQPGVLRLYKSHMSAFAVRDKVRSEGRFITIIRDPKDYRLGFFRCLDRLYEEERKGNSYATSFSARYNVDEFAKVKPILTHVNQERPTYEENVVEWMSLRDESNVLVLFYEDIIHDTRSVLDQLCSFVNIDASTSLRKAILMHTNFTKMHDTYGPMHELSCEEADVKVGQAVNRFGFDANLAMNQLWVMAVKSVNPQWRDYSLFYTGITERPFPFEYKDMPDAEQDFLCADLKEMFLSCFSRFRSNSTSSSQLPQNRFSVWK